ncbi:MAG: preprotein translocase subunit Sec61beta [Candidatus Aenigmatarchaeota archaeon]
MTKKPKLTMPQSTAGLVRYYEEPEKAIKLRPEHIIALCIALMGVVLALRFLV